jgi:hypothetical protein
VCDACCSSSPRRKELAFVRGAETLLRDRAGRSRAPNGARARRAASDEVCTSALRRLRHPSRPGSYSAPGGVLRRDRSIVDAGPDRARRAESRAVRARARRRSPDSRAAGRHRRQVGAARGSTWRRWRDSASCGRARSRACRRSSCAISNAPGEADQVEVAVRGRVRRAGRSRGACSVSRVPRRRRRDCVSPVTGGAPYAKKRISSSVSLRACIGVPRGRRRGRRARRRRAAAVLEQQRQGAAQWDEDLLLLGSMWRRPRGVRGIAPHARPGLRQLCGVRDDACRRGSASPIGGRSSTPARHRAHVVGHGATIPSRIVARPTYPHAGRAAPGGTAAP